MKRGHYIDLTGQRWGKVVALSFVRRDARRHSVWRFRCDCGSEFERSATDVRETAKAFTPSCNACPNAYEIAGDTVRIDVGTKRVPGAIAFIDLADLSAVLARRW